MGRKVKMPKTMDKMAKPVKDGKKKQAGKTKMVCSKAGKTKMVCSKAGKTKKAYPRKARLKLARLKKAWRNSCAGFYLHAQGFKDDTRGQGTTEYAILVGVLVVIAVLAIAIFRPKIEELWNAIAEGINGL